LPIQDLRSDVMMQSSFRASGLTNHDSHQQIKLNAQDFVLSAGFSLADIKSRKDRVRNFSHEIDEVNEDSHYSEEEEEEEK
jgi:hypothetical protein